MEHLETKKIKVAIAAEHFLYRLGVKTIISVIGVEPDIFETNSFETTILCLKNNAKIDFLIITEDLIPIPRESNLSNLRAVAQSCKIMIIGNDNERSCPFSCHIQNTENKKERVDVNSINLIALIII